MKLMPIRFPTIAPAALLAVFLAAFPVTSPATSPATTATGQAPPATGPGVPEKNFHELPDSRNPVEYVSTDGQFSLTFPSGCARLYTKMNTAEDGSADVDVRLVFVNCERNKDLREGCLVNARLGAARGLAPKDATDLVLGEMRKLLAGYGVIPARQTPVRRDFGPHGVVEGLDIQAHPESGGGDVWIRGLLRGEDIYLLAAWKGVGGLLEDPEYGLFFQSFQPWAE